MDGRAYVYIRKIFHSSTISVGLAQARPNKMKSKCKVQVHSSANLRHNLAEILGIFGLKTPSHAYVLGEYTSMKNELYWTNVKSNDV